MRALVIVLALVLSSPAVAAATASTTSSTTAPATDGPGPAGPSTDGPRLVALYPDPIHDGDRGEFVVVDFPRRTNLSGWSLSDGESTVSLPGEAVRGRVAFTAEPSLVRPLTDARVLSVELPALANGGETVRLRHESTVADVRSYGDAEEGARLVRRDGTWTWRPLGATDFPVTRVEGGNVRAFVLPDSPEVPVEALRGADERVLLAGYTFTSRRAARALRAAVERGVTVRVLVEGAPVGGLSDREAAVLDSLTKSGVEVQVLGGPRARYDYQHAKFAVVDDRALVLTENWKPSGTGGRSSRGWGAVVEHEQVADDLAAVFRADAGWRDAIPWTEFRRNRPFTDGERANGTYPSRFEPRTVPVDRVSLLVAPENAERGVLRLLASANESIDVLQPTVGGRDQPFLQATLAAARRGVTVRILLSGAWYVRERNRALVDRLNRRAAAEDLPLEARVAEPRSRFEKIHAKGVVVDRRRVVVGSLNWNNHSARENREVAVVLTGEAVGEYYARTFAADWNGGERRIPAALWLGLMLAVLVAGWYARRKIGFEGQSSVRS